MEEIKDVIQGVMQGWADRRSKPLADDPGRWLKKVLRKKEIGHARARYFNKGVLSIAVDSSSWLYHFNLQKEDLLVKLRKISPKIKSIRLNIGE